MTTTGQPSHGEFSHGEFSHGEVEDAFAEYQRRVRAGDWSAWADLFTDDAVYLDHEHGPFYGREAIRAWMTGVMDRAPGMTSLVEWHVIDGDRVVWYAWSRFPGLPGRAASEFQFAVVSIARYAGGRSWASQEDVYNAREIEAVLAEYLEEAARIGVTLEGAFSELLEER